MKFTDIFIHRPVLATALSLVILLLGLRAYTEMTVREYPAITNTVVTVTTAYPGANPNTIQGFVTTRLERVIASAPGIDYMTSNSSEGMSTITVYMKLNYSPNAAVANIQSKVQQVTNELPAGSQLPVINVTVGNTTDLMYIAFYSDQLSQQQITDYLLRVVQPKLASVSGVGEAQILPPGSGNGNTYSMRVWLNPRKMAALGISAAQVSQVLAANDFISAVGSTRGTETGDTIVATTNLHDAAQFRNLVVKNVGNTIIRLKDIAQVELGAQNYDSSAYFDGKPAAFVGIQEAPSANSLNVAAGVKAALAELGTALPPGMHMAIPYDATDYIKASIDEVLLTIGITLAVVVLVIFLFLGSFRSVLIPAVAIPLSIIGAGFIMWAMGFTINLLTLLAVVLAIGLVVDDAIIVVENVHRHIDEGKSPMQAALMTGRELGSSIVVMSTTLIAVFAPIGFMSGLTGSLFSEFAFTLVATVLVSMVVALTLSPMLSSKILRASSAHGFAHFIDTRYEELRRLYDRLLRGSLNFVPVTLLFAAVIFVSIYFLFTTSKQELAPQEDQGVIFNMGTGAPNITPELLRKYGMKIVHDLEKYPETKATFMVTGISVGSGGGTNSLIAGMRLKNWDKRSVTAMQLAPQVQQQMNGITGLQVASFQRPSLPGSAGGLPVQFVLQSSGGYDKLDQVANDVIDRAQKSGLFVYVTKDLRIDNPEIVLHIHRNMAANLGLTMANIAQDLQPLLGGNYVNRFDLKGRSYEVIPQVPDHFRANPGMLKTYYVATATGQMVPLSTVVSVETKVQPQFLPQFQQLNSATIQAVPAPGVTLGQALTYLKTQAQNVMPKGFSIDYSSQSRQYMQEKSGLLVTFALAILLIYLLLAAQFESFRDPLIVLITVPMSISGALIFISLGLATINIYTEVGLITLIGLIAKQGILIVQFANQIQRHEGLDKRSAVEKASSIRLRPILMTTGAMVLGVLPLLLASGAGAVSRFDMGLVIFTGLAIGSLFSLFVVPAIYMVLAKDLREPQNSREAG
ncbi:MMPL family transporter [Acidithiobacillus ferrooxidans]|uniref:efflux RND transporter permease subunit n=1 Tax=Acidithiobacillus ferrooxidans TaxID=920 RepID=UPI001C06A488|nr:efflux RND transporter permease subunit [Acidithiobacillus ferrooxidans]MBU2856312.1 MMPL family transporter [Acidithiobacillus ferrooxidans]MBU2861658.1 MMPL family transporter [Acidithiobacillus ferrooxidans]MCR2830428.1 efflux RND transporter permease subunit [Acidithiobacillus ferrooxidans]